MTTTYTFVKSSKLSPGQLKVLVSTPKQDVRKHVAEEKIVFGEVDKNGKSKGKAAEKPDEKAVKKDIKEIEKDIEKIAEEFVDKSNKNQKISSLSQHAFLWTDNKKTMHKFQELEKELSHLYLHCPNDGYKEFINSAIMICKEKVSMDKAHIKGEKEKAKSHQKKLGLLWDEYISFFSESPGEINYGSYFMGIHAIIRKLSSL